MTVTVTRRAGPARLTRSALRPRLAAAQRLPPARSRNPSHESYYCVFKFRVRVSGKSTVTVSTTRTVTVALERFPGQITQAQLPC